MTGQKSHWGSNPIRYRIIFLNHFVGVSHGIEPAIYLVHGTLKEQLRARNVLCHLPTYLLAQANALEKPIGTKLFKAFRPHEKKIFVFDLCRYFVVSNPDQLQIRGTGKRTADFLMSSSLPMHA